jgi:hypothetical protein
LPAECQLVFHSSNDSNTLLAKKQYVSGKPDGISLNDSHTLKAKKQYPTLPAENQQE